MVDVRKFVKLTTAQASGARIKVKALFCGDRVVAWETMFYTVTFPDPKCFNNCILNF